MLRKTEVEYVCEYCGYRQKGESELQPPKGWIVDFPLFFTLEQRRTPEVSLHFHTLECWEKHRRYIFEQYISQVLVGIKAQGMRDAAKLEVAKQLVEQSKG